MIKVESGWMFFNVFLIAALFKKETSSAKSKRMVVASASSSRLK